ncbi:MAG: DUF58 domain-containing protein [Porticoccaceae bacterium]
MAFEKFFEDWLERRLPRVERIRLGRRSIFTFPSRAGLFFLLVLALLWLLAINYENNVVFFFAALLGAVFVVTILHGYSNVAGVTLRILAVDSGFPGESLRVDIELSHDGKRHRDDIKLYFPGTTPQQVSLAKGTDSTVASLYVRAKRRGRLRPGRLTVESVYPLGLIRIWSHVRLDGWGAVYPRPGAGASHADGGGAESGAVQSEVAGTEDFAGLEPYRQGEAWNRIAWKQVARGQGVYTKHFVDPAAEPQWLDWAHFPDLDRESRLSRLCGAVLEADMAGRDYGLKLPGESSALGQGEAHRTRLLRMLALFECEDQEAG